MIQGWARKKRILVTWSLLSGIAIMWTYLLAKIYFNTSNLSLRGIVVKAEVVAKEEVHYKNGSVEGSYKVIYLYKKRLYHNIFQNSEYGYHVGDSLRIKIDSKNPESYCELVN